MESELEFKFGVLKFGPEVITRKMHFKNYYIETSFQCSCEKEDKWK